MAHVTNKLHTNNMPSGQENGAFLEAMSPICHHFSNKVSYRLQMPYVGANQSAMLLGGMVEYPIHNNYMMDATRLGSRNIGTTWTNATSPRDASSTSYVEGLPFKLHKEGGFVYPFI
uniref:Uncharacterized protein n=1 Tax=Oryza brachyantha TaxID=4533 RepID=J3MZE3_ORYBR